MRIASGLQPGQVLQRRGARKGADAEVRGECTREGVVAVSIARGAKPLPGWRAKRCGKARGGAFTATLAGIPIGGPYTVTLAVGAEKLVVREIFVGDVWVLAGQSNMQGIGNLDRAPEPHPLVRAFTMDRRWGVAREPIHWMELSPDAAHNPNGVTPEQARKMIAGARKGVGPGIFFGADLVKRTGVPQGLICTAHGGTSMEQWDPAKKGEGGRSMYGSMLLSVRACGQPVAGVLWYQGESDAHEAAAAVYTERMKRLVAAMRADFGELYPRRRMPFLCVQIGRVVRENGPKWWNAIQEQERLLPTAIPAFDTVATIDLPLDDLIHISSMGYARLAPRLARGAARLAHGDRRERPAPSPRSVRMLPRKDYPICQVAFEVCFDHVVGGLRSAGEPRGFALIDGEHREVPAIYKVVLEGDRAILETTLAGDRADLRVMYGHGEDPVCTITDARDMAVPVFGPLAVANMPPSTAFFTTWSVTAVRAGEDIAAMPRPLLEQGGDWSRKTWEGTFVNQHPIWEHATGHAAFVTDVTLAEAMSLELRIGYDGPTRVWIGDDEALHDMKGTNPALADAVSKPVKLGAGTHRVTVLMALNGGRAWGFFLRFGRVGLPKGAPAAGVALPEPIGHRH